MDKLREGFFSDWECELFKEDMGARLKDALEESVRENLTVAFRAFADEGTWQLQFREGGSEGPEMQIAWRKKLGDYGGCFYEFPIAMTVEPDVMLQALVRYKPETEELPEIGDLLRAWREGLERVERHFVSLGGVLEKP